MIPQVEFLVAFYELATDQKKAQEILKDGKQLLESLKKVVEAKTTVDQADKYLDRELAKLHKQWDVLEGAQKQQANQEQVLKARYDSLTTEATEKAIKANILLAEAVEKSNLFQKDMAKLLDLSAELDHRQRKLTEQEYAITVREKLVAEKEEKLRAILG